jgi:hypothetical protein
VGTAEQVHYNFSVAREIEGKLIHFAQKGCQSSAIGYQPSGKAEFRSLTTFPVERSEFRFA